MPFPSFLVPLLQSESQCETILMKMTLIYTEMKLHAELIFISKVSHLDSRHKRTRKWPIDHTSAVFFSITLFIVLKPPLRAVGFSFPHQERNQQPLRIHKTVKKNWINTIIFVHHSFSLNIAALSKICRKTETCPSNPYVYIFSLIWFCARGFSFAFLAQM